MAGSLCEVLESTRAIRREESAALVFRARRVWRRRRLHADAPEHDRVKNDRRPARICTTSASSLARGAWQMSMR